VVTGGTPSNFTKVSATNYTVDVTPTGSATPTVTLPAGKVFDLANNPNAVAFTVITAPTTAAATPTALAANVISIYSDAYTQTTGVNLNPGWGQTTAVTEVQVAGNATEKYATLNYQGIDFVGHAIDVSGMSKLHIDVWTPDVTTLKVSLIATTGGGENAVTLTPTLAGWNSFDIDLAGYTVPDKTRIDQIKIEGSPAGGTLFFDNLYFWKAATALGGGGGSGSGGTVGLTFDEATPPTVVGFNGGESSSIAVGPTGGSANALKIVRIGGDPWAGAKVTGLTISLSAANPTITAHVYSPAAGIPFVLKLEGGGTASAETQASTSVVAGWQTLSWTFSGADLKNWTDLVFLPNLTHVAPGAPGETYYVDDITGVSIPAATSTVAMGAGGAQTMTMYPATGAPACGQPNQPLCLFSAGDYIFAGDYKGGVEAGTGRFATFVGAQSVAPAVLPTALAGGDIGHYNDPAMDTSTQKLDASGWVTGTVTDPGGSPNFFYQFVLTKPASTFTNSYMGVYVNAPQNGTVDVSARSNLKLRIWGPGQMFQDNIPTSTNRSLNPVLNLSLTGPKVANCSSGSGGSEITKDLTANSTIGGAAEYTVSLAGWTLVTGCGGDASAADVLKHVARLVVNVPGTSFNFTNPNGTAGVDATAYVTGVNIGAISFK
jgi:hypothetical protein